MNQKIVSLFLLFSHVVCRSGGGNSLNLSIGHEKTFAVEMMEAESRFDNVVPFHANTVNPLVAPKRHNEIPDIIITQPSTEQLPAVHHRQDPTKLVIPEVEENENGPSRGTIRRQYGCWESVKRLWNHSFCKKDNEDCLKCGGMCCCLATFCCIGLCLRGKN